MKAVFGKHSFTMFEMAKKIGPHLLGVDPDAKPVPAAKRKAGTSSKPAAKRKKAAEGGARGGLAAPKKLSEAMSAVCGGETDLPRTQVVKKLWEYIKANELQDPNDGRQILCGSDPKLKLVFPNVAKVHMMGMNKLIGAHLS